MSGPPESCPLGGERWLGELPGRLGLRTHKDRQTCPRGECDFGLVSRRRSICEILLPDAPNCSFPYCDCPSRRGPRTNTLFLAVTCALSPALRPPVHAVLVCASSGNCLEHCLKSSRPPGSFCVQAARGSFQGTLNPKPDDTATPGTFTCTRSAASERHLALNLAFFFLSGDMNPAEGPYVATDPHARTK